MVVERLTADGWSVVAFDLERPARDSAAFVQGDVAVEADTRRAVAEAESRFGRLDLLVNNAGIGGFTPFAEQTVERWNRVIATNLSGAYLMARHAAALLEKAPGGGVIVNIASTRALQSEPGSEAYAASKGGLVALTHALAASLGPKVRVNCVSPGWIDVSGRSARTPTAQKPTAEDHAQHFAGRIGRPEDVAGLVAWLAGPDAGFMTGANLVLDGGMTRKMIYAE